MNRNDYSAKPKFLNGTNKWYIEVETKELGKVLLLDKNYPDLPIPASFDTRDEAMQYMIEWEKRLSK